MNEGEKDLKEVKNNPKEVGEGLKKQEADLKELTSLARELEQLQARWRTACQPE